MQSSHLLAIGFHPSDNVLVAGLTTLGLIVVALIGKVSFGSAQKASNNANADVVTPDEQKTAAEAISDAAATLVSSYELGVASLTRRVEHAERRMEAAEKRVAKAERTAEDAASEAKAARRDAERWRNLARKLARIVVDLRQQNEALGGKVGAEPEELTMLRVMGDLDDPTDPSHEENQA